MSSKPSSMSARRAVSSLAVLVLAISLFGGIAGADTKSELNAAKAKLEKLIDQISAETREIQLLEGKIAQKHDAIEAVKVHIAQTQAKILKLQGDIDRAAALLLATQRQLDQRAWVAYEAGPGSNVEFLLTSTSLSDLSDRLEILNNAAETDQALIDKVRDQKAQLQTKQQQAEKLKRELRNQEADLQKQQDELQAQLIAAQDVYNKLSADKAAAEKQVKKLKKTLQDEIAAKLEAERLAAAAAASHGGSTEGAVGHPFKECPVTPGSYSDCFGAPRYGGGFHAHAGNDIFAALGTPIKAPFSGTASDSSNTLGGLSVTVSGPDGYVYNAHLSAFGTLGSVSAGTVIGYVGNTGDAQGGAYHDHFEWHPNAIPAHPHVSPYGYSVIGSAIDPYPYLNQVC